ncbi:hypothetical protein EYF80_054554 [Liparis tanakae]|uniref:Uncharacterized protein n=1 Tax=Liparis tanakae TaxID=230148 RepID=A0A4Z2F320_9TELE|nr:hypothetical protein EYF80_054554 [Liparis tanakae]
MIHSNHNELISLLTCPEILQVFYVEGLRLLFYLEGLRLLFYVEGLRFLFYEEGLRLLFYGEGLRVLFYVEGLWVLLVLVLRGDICFNPYQLLDICRENIMNNGD